MILMPIKSLSGKRLEQVCEINFAVHREAARPPRLTPKHRMQKHPVKNSNYHL